MDRFLLDQFEVGMAVCQFDDTPKPPKHHSKKLAAWEDRNYSGTVMEIHEPSDYQPFGSLIIKRDDYPDNGGGIQFRFSVTLGAGTNIVPAPESLFADDVL